MSRANVVQPAGWLAPRGYSNGISASGRVVSIAGQIGWDPVTSVIASGGFAAQTGQALRNIAAVLLEAGGSPEHLVRLTWFITNRDAYTAARGDIGDAYRDIMGKHYPAMSVVIVSELIEPDAQVEIEATAIIPD